MDEIPFLDEEKFGVVWPLLSEFGRDEYVQWVGGREVVKVRMWRRFGAIHLQVIVGKKYATRAMTSAQVKKSNIDLIKYTLHQMFEEMEGELGKFYL